MPSVQVPFFCVSDTNTGLSRRMSSRMLRRDGSADAPLCSFRSPSSRCTKPEKGVKRAGFNSPSVLKTRKAQTRTPKTPSREGCAFYPLSALFPASTSKIPPYSLAREVHSSPLIVNPVDKMGRVKNIVDTIFFTPDVCAGAQTSPDVNETSSSRISR